jgi:carbon starvation protein CstA
MLTFTIALACLLAGYFLYGMVVEKAFRPDSGRSMPCDVKEDDVDYMPLSAWRVYLIQFLNIAGTGPIFGAIMGILYGPAAYLWIVLGCIFAGAVHDYMCGMICVRQGGASLPEIVGANLGQPMHYVVGIASLILLVLVGAVFVITPASLLDNMTPDRGFLWGHVFWIIVIFLYYILATLLPIDKLIGRIYPLFGSALLIMALGIGYCIFTKDGYLPELTDEPFVSHHPKGLPIFPMLCVTIACGAISGFHGTQCPLMSRCMTNEKYGRPIFYGAMITEGVVALIWAAAAVKFADSLPGEAGQTAYEKLAALGNPALVVKEISTSWLGVIGAILAVLGVVAAPITSGDTAFRSARLILADFIGISQKSFERRLMLCMPMFVIAAALMFMEFDVLWRYFAWTNQTMATVMLWTATVWLRNNRGALMACLTLVPAMFMTVVCVSYIIVAPEGLRMSLEAALVSGVSVALVLGALYVLVESRKKHDIK